MDIEAIIELQKEHGIEDIQEKINSGMAWKLEGSYGRAAMSCLESGACMLPTEAHTDYYGNRVPSRDDLEDGSKGTLKNSINFWESVEMGEIIL